MHPNLEGRKEDRGMSTGGMADSTIRESGVSTNTYNPRVWRSSGMQNRVRSMAIPLSTCFIVLCINGSIAIKSSITLKLNTVPVTRDIYKTPQYIVLRQLIILFSNSKLNQ
jgi:hypothetical protein